MLKKLVNYATSTHANLGCVYTHIYYDSFVQETLFLCGHDEVVRVVFVVNYILQVNS